jgi:hypothetical protein
MKKLKEGTYKAKGPRNNKPKGPKKWWTNKLLLFLWIS